MLCMSYSLPGLLLFPINRFIHGDAKTNFCRVNRGAKQRGVKGFNAWGVGVQTIFEGKCNSIFWLGLAPLRESGEQKCKL